MTPLVTYSAAILAMALSATAATPATTAAPPATTDAPPSTPAETPDPPVAKPSPKAVEGILHCEPQTGLPREKLTFLGEEWDCELCLDATSRATGMGARTEFPVGTAMVFVYPRASVLTFWMKDCLIDLDMVFVDADGRITALHEGQRQPLRAQGQSLDAYERGLKRYSSNRRARFVIEVPRGTIARLKPQLGQHVDLDWKALAERAE
jgi:uncharacterized membrane protein (UPF0127 family)